MNAVESRVLEIERRLISLETRTSALRKQAVRVYQNLIDGSIPMGTIGTNWEYNLTVYGVNSRVAFTQDVELQDFYGNVLDSGTTDGSGEITLYAPSTYGGSGLYVVAGLSGGRQRFDTTGQYLADGGDTTSVTFTEATDYYPIDDCAWPIYKDLDVDDPSLNCNQTASWVSAQYWEGPQTMTINYGGCGSPTCPAATLTTAYFWIDWDSGQLLGRGNCNFTAIGGCPDESGPVPDGGGYADLTMVEGPTPTLTGLVRSGLTLWCGATPTWTITEL